MSAQISWRRKQGCYYFAPASLVPEVLSLLRQGWQGAHTLPREVQLDAESASLLMNPVEEVARLRQKQLYSNSSLQLPSNSSSGALKVNLISCSPVPAPCLCLTRSEVAARMRKLLWCHSLAQNSQPAAAL